MATFWDIYFAIRAAEKVSRNEAENAGKTRAEIKAERKAKSDAKWKRREERVEAWSKQTADKLNVATEKIQANSEKWYKRLGIKYKPKQ